jgi:hypothetical protein
MSTFRGKKGVQKVMVQPINLIFRFLQNVRHPIVLSVSFFLVRVCSLRRRQQQRQIAAEHDS